MPIIPHFDSQSGLVTLTVEGEVSGANIKEALGGVVDDPRFRPGADMLWDFREALGVDMRGEAIQDLVSFVGSLKEKRGTDYRVALVAEADVLYGFARMYEAYAEHLPFVLKVFRDMVEAQNWLRGAPPQKDAST
jgi:hypothetical protein